MFFKVIKREWIFISIISASFAICAFLILHLLFIYTVPLGTFERRRLLTASLVMSSFGGLIGFFGSYTTSKERIDAKERVLDFSRKYKVGDQFWALHRNSIYDPTNPSTVFDNIYHFKVKEINFRKGYFKLSEEFRPNWEPSLMRLSDYIIFDSKNGLLIWLKSIKKDYEMWQDQLESLIEGVKQND